MALVLLMLGAIIGLFLGVNWFLMSLPETIGLPLLIGIVVVVVVLFDSAYMSK